MRVLVVTVVHDPEDARIRHRQIPALLDAGHEVTYAAPFTAFDRTPPQQVRSVDLPRASGRRRLGAVRAARRQIARLRDEVDVVLLHDPDLLLAVVGRTDRVIWDVHEDTAAALGMRDWVPGAVAPILAMVVRAAERWASTNLTLLLAERGYAARFEREHTVVPNSVLVPQHEPPAPGADRVVYLGKVTTARGCAEMIETGRRLSGPQVQVIGSADSSARTPLRQAADSGAIDWAGFVPNDTALGMLDGALAGLSLLHDQPNYAHSEPTKLMEYMAHGIPVITTPNQASVDLVQRADCGIVVPFGDAEAVVQAITSLAQDRAECERLGANGYRYAREHLDWRRDAQTFVAALEAVASGSRSPRST